MDGTLGHFWMNFGDVYNLDKAADGYVRLAEDGQLLLLGELLNRVAGNRTPMKAIASSHRTQHLKQRIQKLVAAS
jgi:hypothetical protein